jgi:hypothetical protein
LVSVNLTRRRTRRRKRKVMKTVSQMKRMISVMKKLTLVMILMQRLVLIWVKRWTGQMRNLTLMKKTWHFQMKVSSVQAPNFARYLWSPYFMIFLIYSTLYYIYIVV